eukprot:11957055-Ditylum_brightwellii.AAC.1
MCTASVAKRPPCHIPTNITPITSSSTETTGMERAGQIECKIDPISSTIQGMEQQQQQIKEANMRSNIPFQHKLKSNHYQQQQNHVIDMNYFLKDDDYDDNDNNTAMMNILDPIEAIHRLIPLKHHWKEVKRKNTRTKDASNNEARTTTKTK